MKKKSKVLLIQPHADDILFSASKYLFNKDNYKDVKILTVESGNQKRVKEDEELCKFFGVGYINLGIDFEDDSYYHYYKRFNTFSWGNCSAILTERYGKEFLDDIKKRLKKIVKTHKKDGYKIIIPLGVGHPMHWFVRNCLGDLADLFYRDFPHSYKRKTALDLKDVTESYFELDNEYFDEDEHEMKFQISYQIYKTQRSLLFFEKGYIDKKIPEQFYTLRT
jgi:hypothetical protein